jgi:hypothetical protein
MPGEGCDEEKQRGSGGMGRDGRGRGKELGEEDTGEDEGCAGE